MAYIGKSPSNGIRNRFIYTATAGQTTFSGSDDHSRTLSYTDAEFTDVFLNGVKLDKSDYTATSGTSVVLDEGAAIDDILEVLAFDTFSVFSGEFSQDVTVGGTLDVQGGEVILDADGDTSITADTDDEIHFKTNGSDRVKIMADGDIEASAGTSLDTAVQIHSPQSSLCPQLKLTRNGGGTSTNQMLSINNSGGEVAKINADGSAYFDSSLAAIHNTSTQSLSNGTRGLFYSSYLVVGNPNDVCGILNRQSSTGNILQFRYNGAVKGNIVVNSGSVSYNTTSDHRLKENVEAMTGAINRVKTLKPKRFNFIGDSDTVDGFLAHEAQTVVPEAVHGTHNEVDGDGNAVYQGIDQAKLVPLLTAALQEAIAKIETLETKVAALEAN